MEPVISPWVFYWVDMLQWANRVISVLMAVGVVGSFILVCLSVSLAKNGEWSGEEAKPFRRIVLWSEIAFIFVVLLYVGIPSQSTAYKMLIAQQVTVDRVEKGSQALDKIYNDILKRVDKALDKKD